MAPCRVGGEVGRLANPVNVVVGVVDVGCADAAGVVVVAAGATMSDVVATPGDGGGGAVV